MLEAAIREEHRGKITPMQTNRASDNRRVEVSKLLVKSEFHKEEKKEVK